MTDAISRFAFLRETRADLHYLAETGNWACLIYGTLDNGYPGLVASGHDPDPEGAVDEAQIKYEAKSAKRESLSPAEAA